MACVQAAQACHAASLHRTMPASFRAQERQQSSAFLVISSLRCYIGSFTHSGQRAKPCVRPLQEDMEEVVSLQEMQKYNTSELQLPQVPLSQGGTMMKAKPQRIPSWAAVPRRK